MGLLGAVRRHREAREEQVREAAYRKAILRGESEEKAMEAGERAVRRRRRIVRAAVISGGH